MKMILSITITLARKGLNLAFRSLPENKLCYLERKDASHNIINIDLIILSAIFQLAVSLHATNDIEKYYDIRFKISFVRLLKHSSGRINRHMAFQSDPIHQNNSINHHNSFVKRQLSLIYYYYSNQSVTDHINIYVYKK